MHEDLMKREVKKKKRRKSTGSEQLGKAHQIRRLRESHLLLSGRAGRKGRGAKIERRTSWYRLLACRTPIHPLYNQNLHCPPVYLQSASILQQLRQIALLGLQIRISTNVLLADPNAWDSRLACHFGKSALDCGAVI